MVVAMATNGMSLNVVAPPQEPREPRIPENYMENGREYHAFRKGKYLFPCDEMEMDRHDIYHKFFSVARNGALHSPHIKISAPEEGSYRVLDLGTGTGIWAIDMADRFFRTIREVQGLDLTQIQPQQIPPSLTFLKRDIEGPWHGLGEDSWDMIHMRMMNGSIANWADIYAKIFRHLRPGRGWLEHVELDMYPRCDDGTLPPNSGLMRWTHELFEATAMAYRPLAYNTETRSLLERQGFVDIKEEVIRVPLNSWPGPGEEHQREIGRWYNLGLTQGLEALSLAPLIRVKGWKREDVNALVEEVRRDVCSRGLHVYHTMHIFTARRP